jgi:hypothetical protein
MDYAEKIRRTEEDLKKLRYEVIDLEQVLILLTGLSKKDTEHF